MSSLLFDATRRRISFRISVVGNLAASRFAAVQYRHVILEKRVPWEKPSVTITAVMEARGNNLWRKVYFSRSGVTREKTNKTDIFYKGLLFLNPETFLRPFAEFLFYLRTVPYAPETSRFSFFCEAEHRSGRNHESGTCIQGALVVTYIYITGTESVFLAIFLIRRT